jgi:hypothetical protein
MILEKFANVIVPNTKTVYVTDEMQPDLDVYQCKRMVEDFLKQNIPQAIAVTIVWVDKNNLVNSAYCNLSPLNRLWILAVAWLQELFDFKIRQHEKK